MVSAGRAMGPLRACDGYGRLCTCGPLPPITGPVKPKVPSFSPGSGMDGTAGIDGLSRQYDRRRHEQKHEVGRCRIHLPNSSGLYSRPFMEAGHRALTVCSGWSLRFGGDASLSGNRRWRLAFPILLQPSLSRLTACTQHTRSLHCRPDVRGSFDTIDCPWPPGGHDRP
jgi:hypothetical protein